MGRVAQPRSLGGMRLKITRRLVPKETDEFGNESAEIPVDQGESDVAVRVESWNDRFFEVVTTSLVLEAGDLMGLFDDEDDEDV